MDEEVIREALQGNDGPLRTLHPDALRYMALFLDANDILSLCQTSTYFNTTVCRNDGFWWQLIERDLTSNPDRIAGLRKRVDENKINPHKGGDDMMEEAASPRQIYNLMYSDEIGPLSKLEGAAKYGFEIYMEKMLPAMKDINAEYLLRTYPDEFNDDEDDNGENDDDDNGENGDREGRRGYNDDTMYEQIGEEITHIQTEVVPPAAEEGYLDILKILADKGYALGSSLPHAAYSGDLDVVKFIIKNRGEEDDDYPAYYMGKALSEAAARGNLEMVDYFLDEEDLDINGEETGLGTPVSYALIAGNPEMVKYLISRGATLNESSMRSAIQGGNADSVKLLEQQGIPITRMAYFDTINSRQDEILKYLIEKHPLADYDEVIRRLFQTSNIPMVDYILERNPGIDLQALLKFVAETHGSLRYDDARETFKYLLTKGADPSKLNPRDISGDLLPLYREAIAKMKPKLARLPTKEVALTKPPQRAVLKPSPRTSPTKTRPVLPVTFKRTISPPKVTKPPSPVREEVGLKPGYCQALTRGGKGPQCSRPVSGDEKFCWQHQPKVGVEPRREHR